MTSHDLCPNDIYFHVDGPVRLAILHLCDVNNVNYCVLKLNISGKGRETYGHVLDNLALYLLCHEIASLEVLLVQVVYPFADDRPIHHHESVVLRDSLIRAAASLAFRVVQSY